MSTWLQRNNTYFTASAAFAVGAVFATVSIYTLTNQRRNQLKADLKASIPSISPTHPATQLTEYGAAGQPSITSATDRRAATIAARARKGEYDEELILEQLARTRVFLTDEGLQTLRDAFVVVIGLGGVGSHAVSSLVRSGVSKIRIVDFDQVTLSSLNRHAVATLADVGSPKVHAMRRRMEQICPWARIDAVNELFSSQSATRLLADWDYELHTGEEPRQPDFVVDAIDNVDTKVQLLQYCYNHSLKVISAMGAGCKSDATRVSIADISMSIEDPLSKAVRRRLKVLGISSGIPAVFSTEKPGAGKAALLPVNEAEAEKGDVRDLSVLPDFRVRILPVLGPLPAVFGHAVASYVLTTLAGYPTDYTIGERGREKMYEAMLSALQGQEERLARSKHGAEAAVGLRLAINLADVGYLVEEVYRGKSIISGLVSRLVLTRWSAPTDGENIVTTYQAEGQRSSNLEINNVVVMTKEEAKRHENEILKGGKKPEELYEVDVLRRVERYQAEERAYAHYR